MKIEKTIKADGLIIYNFDGGQVVTQLKIINLSEVYIQYTCSACLPCETDSFTGKGKDIAPFVTKNSFAAKFLWYVLRTEMPQCGISENHIDLIFQGIPYLEFKKGDLILCTLWKDGDPRDAWYVGFFSHIIKEKDRIWYYVQDENGHLVKRGFPLARKITEKQGKFLLEYRQCIEESGVSLFWWLKNATDLEHIKAQILILKQEYNKYYQSCQFLPETDKNWRRMENIDATIKALEHIAQMFKDING